MASDQTPTTRLTPQQEALLRCIVQSNGGGISITDRRVFLALHRKGLAHQKLGNPYRAVHTREGLAWVRANQQVSAT
jgi:uncharacterized protein YjhX (UPF0386 family)